MAWFVCLWGERPRWGGLRALASAHLAGWSGKPAACAGSARVHRT